MAGRPCNEAASGPLRRRSARKASDVQGQRPDGAAGPRRRVEGSGCPKPDHEDRVSAHHLRRPEREEALGARRHAPRKAGVACWTKDPRVACVPIGPGPRGQWLDRVPSSDAGPATEGQAGALACATHEVPTLGEARNLVDRHELDRDAQPVRRRAFGEGPERLDAVGAARRLDGAPSVGATTAAIFEAIIHTGGKAPRQPPAGSSSGAVTPGQAPSRPRGATVSEERLPLRGDHGPWPLRAGERYHEHARSRSQHGARQHAERDPVLQTRGKPERPGGR